MHRKIAPRPIYVAGFTANLLIHYLDQQGLAMAQLREQLSQLADKPRMSVDTWWALLDEIYRAEPLPGLGLRIGSCIQPHHAGVLGYLALYCDTLGQALLRFSRFQPLLHNLAPALISQDGDDLLISWGLTQNTSTRLSDDVVSAALITSIRQLLGRSDFAPSRIESALPAPADLRPYTEHFACPVVFACPASTIRLPIQAMNLPINSQNPHLMSLLEQQAETLLQALPSQDALIADLQRQIVAVLQDGPAELPVVAARMGLTERTLYRSLQERGLRYKNVLNSLRYQLAKDYLRDPQLSLPEIALLLGYAEQSVFSRAFKTWSGQSPMGYRKGL